MLPLKALFDRSPTSATSTWRCYSHLALNSDETAWSTGAKLPAAFCTFSRQSNVIQILQFASVFGSIMTLTCYMLSGVGTMDRGVRLDSACAPPRTNEMPEMFRRLLGNLSKVMTAANKSVVVDICSTWKGDIVGPSHLAVSTQANCLNFQFREPF